MGVTACKSELVLNLAWCDLFSECSNDLVDTDIMPRDASPKIRPELGSSGCQLHPWVYSTPMGVPYTHGCTPHLNLPVLRVLCSADMHHRYPEPVPHHWRARPPYRAHGKRFRVIDSIFEILTVVLHFESAMVRNMSQRARKNHQMPKWSRISMEMILMYKSLNFWID